MFRLAYLVLMIATIARGFQESNVTDPEREKDVYAIYSLMLTNPKTSHGPGADERYLIRATTVPGTPGVPCVRPPKEREADFREVLADFERRSATPRQLERELSIRKPYVLLNADQVKQFLDERSLHRNPPGTGDEQFRGVTDLFSLSDVYFNQRRSLALTALSSWCGSLCGLYQWKVFEKVDTGTWEERDWLTCITVARLY
ncbi:MAG: hypothetical protein ABSG13_25745 [Bryobacteraceae bacterium]|jgi:hypothetical protein